jgi:glucose 1-dehydrogenase
MRLKDKVAVVTGSARGIGRAIAEAMAREGAAVLVTDVLSAAAEETAAAIERAGGRAGAVTADLKNPATHELIVQTALDRFGRLDILVNNAAIEFRESFLDARPETWDATMSVNLKAPFFLAQQAARAMIASGGGKIINIASIHDFQPMRNISIYSIAKGGLMMLNKSLALELAEHKINVNAISPGAIETDLNRAVLADPAHRARVSAQIPWGRIGRTEDIAGAAVFLASSEADYMTGATIYVDGGMLLQ